MTDPPHSGWIIGVVIFLAGYTLNGLGQNLQRYSARKEAEKAESNQRPCYKQPFLLLGIGLFVASGAMLSAALPFAPQTLLAPCGTVIFVANVVFAHYINEERFCCFPDGFCLATISGGIVLCLLNAPKKQVGVRNNDDENTQTYTAAQLQAFYTATPFLVFLSFISIVAIACWFGKRYLRQVKRQRSIGFCMYAGLLAGILGGFNQTVTKSMWTVYIGKYEHHGGMMGIVDSPTCWVLGLALAFSFPYQLYAIADGISEVPAMIFVPVQTGTEVLTGVLGGLFYWQDYKVFQPWHAVIFSVGIFTAFAGVASLVIFRDCNERNEEGFECAYSECTPTPCSKETKPLLGVKTEEPPCKVSQCCR